MKCIVLAGGRGDRLWPLSRKSYPKQFIKLQKTHSMFQETIARNLPFCDEFVVVTNKEYQFIIENQLSVFQGLTESCIFEELGRKTTAAIILACLQFPMSETVLVVPTDQLIEGEEYKEAILRGKELSKEGYLVTFGMQIEEPEERFGYIRFRGEDVLQFTEKPDRVEALEYQKSKEYLVNSGTFMFRVGDMLQELKAYSPELDQACRRAYKARKHIKSHMLYTEDILKEIPAVAIEKSVFEHTKRAKVVHCAFRWKDIGSLEDLKATELETEKVSKQVAYHCDNTEIINQCSRSTVVANELKDILIVNTPDAVYVGKKGKSDELKSIIRESPQIKEFVNCGRTVYRAWGSYELLVDEMTYRVKKIIIYPGKTIYAHSHKYRSEHWSVVSGTAKIELNGVSGIFNMNDVIDVSRDMVHQVSNVGIVPLIIIEVSVGENVSEEDMISIDSRDLTEIDLGYRLEPYVKLQPSYKDYLWGGTRLKEIYHKNCDYDIIAESWELSAHTDGQSTVASGRHKGMLFAEYLEKVGKESLGWKCQSLPRFPILIKFIDASAPLSIQVHPDDEYALEVEGEYGKNEMWYIVDAGKDAFIYCGFVKEVSREDVEERIRTNTILDILNKVPVKKGEVYFIPAGTVHAIGDGLLVCEVQQSSSCTYRLYDYNRKDRFGNYRELHIEKALDVIDYKPYMPQRFEAGVEKTEEYESRLLCSCKYFECIKYTIEGSMEIPLTEESFMSLICITGSGSIETDDLEYPAMYFKDGESIFLPKSDKICRIKGKCEILITRV
ncbi:MAG: NTP transferase domain-containing protein [Clostridiales bacterium]|nr:NTP transferase domain-containing protein [Clostridiales bacterium]